MIDPIQAIRHQCSSVADSIRWSCILEATAPKAGNVFPGRSFHDLTYLHFVQAAEVASQCLTKFDQSIGQRINACVRRSREVTGTNVNLGIVLLIAPLAEASHLGCRVADVLAEINDSDGPLIFDAIQIAGAGGLGQVDEMDVRVPVETVDVMAAMRLAAHRDRIALQYGGEFQDLSDNIVPLVSNAIRECGDLLSGICNAHLQILATSPDTLITRKFGVQVAKQVQHRASEIDLSDPESRTRFDQWLRHGGDSQSHPLNPGTTADLIAAALFVLLTLDT